MAVISFGLSRQFNGKKTAPVLKQANNKSNIAISFGAKIPITSPFLTP